MAKDDKQRVEEAFKALTWKAIRKADELLESENETIALKAMDSVLDRGELNRKGGGSEGAKTLVLNFPPEYVGKALEGARKVLNGEAMDEGGVD